MFESVVFGLGHCNSRISEHILGLRYRCLTGGVIFKGSIKERTTFFDASLAFIISMCEVCHTHHVLIKQSLSLHSKLDNTHDNCQHSILYRHPQCLKRVSVVD